jgi:prepilin-type N-terminal cleavage/methylation domain-containing protein
MDIFGTRPNSGKLLSTHHLSVILTSRTAIGERGKSAVTLGTTEAPQMRRCTRLAAAGGFTLVELLVVVAIIGLLMAMLLPAIQQARETARRSSCVNNMRQIGVAVHMYHNAHDAFPPGGYVTGYNPEDPTYTCWTIQILPFLEQKEVYDRYNQFETNDSPANKTVRETFIPSYSCPSDIFRNVPTVPNTGPPGTPRYMPGSYRGVGGKSDGSSGAWDGIAVNTKVNNPPYKALPRRWKGVFHVVDRHLRPESFAAVTDGLSNTLMVGEYSTRPISAPPNNKNPLVIQKINETNGMARRTFWACTYGPYNRSEAIPESRTLLGDFDRCSMIGGQGAWKPCDRAWGSFHTDLLNFLLCDGSVQTFSLTIDTKIFAEAATMAGKEFAPLP